MTANYTLARVSIENYPLFDEMVQRRMHGAARPAPATVAPAIAQALADPNLWVYAAQMGERFVGWISLIYLPKVGRFGGRGHIYVDELWVEPPYRRQGIAQALLAKADALAEAKAASGVRLYVHVENQGAQQLYACCGFRPAGTAYFMEK